jgi:Sigma-54 interaction domain
MKLWAFPLSYGLPRRLIEPTNPVDDRGQDGIVQRTEDVIRSLLVSTRVLGAREILIVNHTGCGMMTFKDDELQAKLRQSSRTAVVEPARPFSFVDLEQDTREQVQKVRTDPWILKEMPVRGVVHDVHTGKMKEVIAWAERDRSKSPCAPHSGLSGGFLHVSEPVLSLRSAADLGQIPGTVGAFFPEPLGQARCWENHSDECSARWNSKRLGLSRWKSAKPARREVVLSRIVSGLVAQENVALVRLWLAAQGDFCDACRLRDECPNQTRCLHLMASAGNPVASAEDWSRLNGDSRRMPFNARKVGVIGATDEPIPNQPGPCGKPVDCAAGLGPTRRNSQLCRTAADVPRRNSRSPCRFQPRAVSTRWVDWLRIFADHAAIAIANAQAFEEITELRRRLEMERDYLREEVKEALAFGEIVGRSTALRSVLEQVEMVAPTDATVLILGEFGTGKELVAFRRSMNVVRDASTR